MVFKFNKVVCLDSYEQKESFYLFYFQKESVSLKPSKWKHTFLANVEKKSFNTMALFTFLINRPRVIQASNFGAANKGDNVMDASTPGITV